MTPTRCSLLIGAILLVGALASPLAGAESDQRTFLHAEGILREGKTGEAREAFQRVVDGYPESPLADDALYRLATLDFLRTDVEELGRMDATGAAEAFALLERIRSDYPDSDRAADARYLEGLAHMVPGAALYDLDRAFAAFREVVDVYPRSAVAPRALAATAAVELRAGRPGRALLYLERLLLEHPAHPAAANGRLAIADAYLRLGNVREALVRLAPLQSAATGPAAQAALDLSTLIVTLDLPDPGRKRAARPGAGLHSPEGMLRQVGSMTFDDQGRLHVLCEGGKKIVRLTPTGELEEERAVRDVRTLFAEPGGGMGWASAESLHMGSETLAPSQGAGSAARPLRDIAHVAAAADGSFYILEAKGTELLHVAADGSFLGIVARPGRGVDLTIDRQGRVYVLDARRRQVVRRGPGGEELDSLDVSNDTAYVHTPLALAVDDAYHVYVLDGKSGDVVILDSRGRSLLRLQPDADDPEPVRDPEALVISDGGAVLLYDAKMRVVRSFR